MWTEEPGEQQENSTEGRGKVREIPDSGPSPGPRPSVRSSRPLLPPNTFKAGAAFYPTRSRDFRESAMRSSW